MPTPEPGVPWTSGTIDDMTSGIRDRNEASDDAMATDAEVTDLLAGLAQLDDSTDGDITWDTTTVPGAALPVLKARVPRFLLFDEKSAGVSNNAAQTTLLDAPLVIPANTWALGSILRWSLSGSITNNTGGARDATIRIKKGTDVVFSFVFAAIPTSATARTWRYEAVTAFRSFVGTNLLGAGEMALGATTAAADTIVRSRAPELVAFDLASSLSWDITAELSGAASSALSCTLAIGVLEFARA